MADAQRSVLLTYDQAAEILGCGVSKIPKLIRKGELTSYGGRGQGPSLRRDEVQQLAEARAWAAEERRIAKLVPKASDPPAPVNGRGWLTPDQAGALIGITGQAVRMRCRRDKLPHVRAGRLYWVREDHARLAAHVWTTDGPETIVSVR